MWNFKNDYQDNSIAPLQGAREQVQSVTQNIQSAGYKDLSGLSQGIQTSVNTIKPYSGGKTDETGKKSITDYSGTVNAIGGGLLSLGTGVEAYREAKNTPVGYTDENKVKYDNANKVSDQIHNAVASVTGPFGMLFRGIQMGGEGLGKMIGGETGSGVSGAFSPVSGTLSAVMSDDYSFGERLLAIDPVFGGVLKHRKEQRRKKLWEKEKFSKERKSMLRNTFEERERNNKLNEGQQQLDSEIALRQQQLGLINNY